MNDFIKQFNLDFNTHMYCVGHDVNAVVRWDTYRKLRIVTKKNTKLNTFEKFINTFLRDKYGVEHGIEFIKDIFYGSNEFSPANCWIDLTPSAFIDIRDTIGAEYEKWELICSTSIAHYPPVWIPLKQPYGERTAIVIDKNFIDILNNIVFAWYKYTEGNENTNDQDNSSSSS